MKFVHCNYILVLCTSNTCVFVFKRWRKEIYGLRARSPTEPYFGIGKKKKIKCGEERNRAKMEEYFTVYRERESWVPHFTYFFCKRH